MNKQRRKEIEEALTKIQDGRDAIESLKDEEQDYFDNMPESLQGGEKGDAAQSAIDALESALSSLDEAIDSINESTNN